MPDYDAVIIGAGQAGPPLAMRLAQAGRMVALVERAAVSSTCVNTGCTPTKTLVASTYVAHMVRRAAEYGVVVDGSVGADMKRVKARKDSVVEQQRQGLKASIEQSENCTFLQGHARFLSSCEVGVGDRVLRAERFFIDAGARDRAGHPASIRSRI